MQVADIDIGDEEGFDIGIGDGLDAVASELEIRRSEYRGLAIDVLAFHLADVELSGFTGIGFQGAVFRDCDDAASSDCNRGIFAIAILEEFQNRIVGTVTTSMTSRRGS